METMNRKTKATIRTAVIVGGALGVSGGAALGGLVASSYRDSYIAAIRNSGDHSKATTIKEPSKAGLDLLDGISLTGFFVGSSVVLIGAWRSLSKSEEEKSW